jgi:hypothetical protein
LLSGALRKDGSSRFGKDNRWGVFPSISAAWLISNEDFLKDNVHISELKIRASWGKLGNQEIGVYPYSSLVSTGERVYAFGDKIVTGATILETGNSGIRGNPARSPSWNRLRTMNDKLTFAADFIVKNPKMFWSGCLYHNPVVHNGRLMSMQRL